MPTALTVDDSDGHSLIVEGRGRVHYLKDGPFVAPFAVVENVPLAELARALRDESRCCHRLPDFLYVANEHPATFDIEAELSVYFPKPVPTKHQVRSWMEPSTQGLGCRVTSVRLTNEEGSEENLGPANIHAQLVAGRAFLRGSAPDHSAWTDHPRHNEHQPAGTEDPATRTFDTEPPDDSTPVQPEERRRS